MTTPLESLHVDVAIVGAGTAGIEAYKAARALVERVVLIDSGPLGTTCARVGCMPSKLLIAAADAAHQVRHAGPFGIDVQGVTVDGAAVMRRVRYERDRFVDFTLAQLNAMPSDDRLTARVRFQDANTLVTEHGQQIHAKRVVIATGSVPVATPMLADVHRRLLTNDTLFDLTTLPQSLAVFGSGVLGMELAQAMARLGVQVKVFGKGGGLAGIQDAELRDYANNTFNETFYVDTAAQVRSVNELDNAVQVQYLHRDGTWHTETFDNVLAATGRAPDVKGLGLENTGLLLDSRGVPVADRLSMQCGNSPIFVAGDASNQQPLLHEAADQGRIAGDNAARYPDIRPGLRRTPLAVVFTDPQIASVGVKLAQLEQDHAGRFAVGQVSFENQGRSRILMRNQGMLKVYAECGSGLFLGAEMFGPAAEHIAHLLAWAAQQRLTVSHMLDMPFYHPVIEEGVRTALNDVRRKLAG